MRSNPQWWPKEPWTVEVIGTQPRIFDAKGRDITNHPAVLERTVQCVNACKGIWYPENHIPASKGRIDNLERLRKSAWARVQELEQAANQRPVSEPAE